MRHARSLARVSILATLISLATPAAAQTQPDRSRVALASGAQIIVTTSDGKTQNGRLGTTTASEIMLVRGGTQRRIPWTDIRQIDRNFDVSIPKSTLVGLGAGLGVGLVSLGTGGCTEDAGTFALECVGLWGGVGAGAGALTGVLINAARSPRTIYRGDRQRQVFVTPVVLKRQLGIAGTIRW